MNGALPRGPPKKITFTASGARTRTVQIDPMTIAGAHLPEVTGLQTIDPASTYCGRPCPVESVAEAFTAPGDTILYAARR
jgi:hypothetical protein